MSISTTTSVGSGKETVLIIEDDAQLCATVVDMLKESGYRVLEAHDAASALTIIESDDHIDLLFIDVPMSGSLRNIDLAEKAKAFSPNIGILFTLDDTQISSGDTQNAIVQGGRLDPGVEILSKPYTHEELARKIRHVLANQQHVAQLKAKIAEARISSPPPMPKRLRILLVEDEPIIRLNTTQLLQRLGHSVISAASKETALIALQNNPFDVLITDINLSGESGIVLATEAKKIHPTIGVIYATGENLTEKIDDTVVLSKPYTINMLQSALSPYETLTEN